MAKGCHCKKPGECEECPEWIFTFADLVMLMMGFFVILWVLKPNPTNPSKGAGENAKQDEDWIKAAASIREAFGYVPDPQKDSSDRINSYIIEQHLNMTRPRKDPGDGGETKIKRVAPEGTDPEVTSIRNGKQVTAGGRMIFDAGNGMLSPDVQHQLDAVADVIRGHRNIVLVKGHTALDDLPATATPQQQMGLSLRRAQAAADYLVGKGVSPDSLRVEGCSTFEPILRHVYSADEQAANRRVEVEVTSSLIQDHQDPHDAAPSAASSSPAN